MYEDINQKKKNKLIRMNLEIQNMIKNCIIFIAQICFAWALYSFTILISIIRKSILFKSFLLNNDLVSNFKF